MPQGNSSFCGIIHPMVNVFEISDIYLKQIENYQDETIPLTKVLESSQNLLFRLYLARRTSHKEGFFEEEIFPFIKVKYYVGNGRFVLFDLNSYKEGYHSKDELKSSYICSSPVLSLLDESLSLINDDELRKSLDSYPTFTDWFKKLLDKLDKKERESISLSGIKSKRFKQVLEEEKKKIEEELPPIKVEEKVQTPIVKEEPKKQYKKDNSIHKPIVKTASFVSTDELEEKKLIALQNKAIELDKRIKKRVGIHFGWEEIFIYGNNADEMLTMIDKKVRQRGLKGQDDDWIIVLTYTVEDEDYIVIKEHYPNHVYRSDDIKHKPSPEFVSLAIVVSPRKNIEKEDDYGVKKVKNKSVSFVNISPERGYTGDSDLFEDSETEEQPRYKKNDGIICKVKYKGAIFNNYVEPKPFSITDENDEEPLDQGGSYYNNNGEYGYEEPLPSEEEISIPKHWKCPFCPSKNPWHTEEPARVITKSDGTHIFLCKKHKNNRIG